MDELTVERISEMLYGVTESTKDQRKYVKSKFNNILDGQENLYIRDKSQSTNFVEGICHLIRDFDLQIKENIQFRKIRKTFIKQDDWDYISDKYQHVLQEIKLVKDECNKKIKEVEDEYYMKLKGNLLDTKPYQDLINKYTDLDQKYINKENELQKSEVKNLQLKETYDNILDQYEKESDKKDDDKLRKKIEKEMSKKEDDTKKHLQKQVNNLKKLLKLEQDKNMLLINNSL
tara:strand:- start:15 stop:710 length:696 start_codon:yes stop_codon:yes gene_type:complete